MLRRLGPAINSGRGLVPVRSRRQRQIEHRRAVTAGVRPHIWIPPLHRRRRRNHPPVRPQQPRRDAVGKQRGPVGTTKKIDRRWVRIRRPTIIVGGELTMDHLEVPLNRPTGINEAPLQLKSNCGTLVIDDFGRQRMQHRRIAQPLDRAAGKRCDFLNLASGKKIQVPFDQLIIFSTNLEPKELVDDAFLRASPTKSKSSIRPKRNSASCSS